MMGHTLKRLVSQSFQMSQIDNKIRDENRGVEAKKMKEIYIIFRETDAESCRKLIKKLTTLATFGKIVKQTFSIVGRVVARN